MNAQPSKETKKLLLQLMKKTSLPKILAKKREEEQKIAASELENKKTSTKSM